MTGEDLMSLRAALLREAEDLITGDRNNTYGPPTQDFARTAGVLNALGYRSANGEIKPHDVAIIISAVKLSRLQWSPEKRDNWADLAGYAACGYECAVEDERKKTTNAYSNEEGRSEEVRRVRTWTV